jgi:ATP-dependent exoDNAse (exonuclease V) beta subunit
MMPDIDLDNIFAYRYKSNETRNAHFICMLCEWDLFRQNGDYFPMPNCIDICSNQTLIQLCDSELKDFLRWKQNSEKFFVTKIVHLYKLFRINSGKLKYEDLINLSIDLLKNPSIISEIENSPYHVILDEAQDMDTQQFRFLLGIAQKVVHEGISMDISNNFLETGYF